MVKETFNLSKNTEAIEGCPYHHFITIDRANTDHKLKGIGIIFCSRETVLMQVSNQVKIFPFLLLDWMLLRYWK